MDTERTVSAVSRFWLNFLKTTGVLLACTLISIGFKHLKACGKKTY